MNQQFWSRPPLSPYLNYDLTNLMTYAYDPNVVAEMQAVLVPYQSAGYNFEHLPITSVIPPVVYIWNAWGLTIMIGGTSGQIHLNELFQGWNNEQLGPDASYGASGGFAHAARVIFSHFPPAWWLTHNRIYLVGHSYGGAVAQALAMLVKIGGLPLEGVWSYGAPRPGNSEMQRYMATVNNYRWWSDADPVRFIPPHSEETSILDTFSRTSLVIGMNKQVQTPIGYRIDAFGEMTPDAGEPTVLHAVALSVIGWVFDNHGFRSVNHAASEYRRRFQQGIPLKPSGPNRPNYQQEEKTGTVRPREVLAQEEAAIPLIESQLAIPASELNAEIRQLPLPVPNVRYQRRRDGGIWVVKYGDNVVDVGPGKRRAGQKARRYNKLAAAT